MFLQSCVYQSTLKCNLIYYLYVGGGSAQICRPETDIFEESSPGQRKVTTGHIHRPPHGHFSMNLSYFIHTSYHDCVEQVQKLLKLKLKLCVPQLQSVRASHS